MQMAFAVNTALMSLLRRVSPAELGTGKLLPSFVLVIAMYWHSVEGKPSFVPRRHGIGNSGGESESV